MSDVFGRRVGGSLALDFVNTVQGRVSRGRPRGGRDYVDVVVDERLPSYEALLRWSTFAGLLTNGEAIRLAHEASARRADAAGVLERSLALREAMYRMFKAALEEWSPRGEDLAVFNRELRTARAHERLTASPRYRWEWEATRRDLDRMLWPIVRTASDLLTTADLERVGQCPGDECGWLFLDTSRSRRRQWCDMAQCGNLAKVRRFRQKHHAPH